MPTALKVGGEAAPSAPPFSYAYVGVRLPGGTLPLTIPQEAFFPLDAPTLGCMASERVGSPLHFKCRYLLSHRSSKSSTISSRFFVENVAISRKVVPAVEHPPSFCRAFAGQSIAGFLHAANHAAYYRRRCKGRLPDAGGQWLVGAR